MKWRETGSIRLDAPRDRVYEVLSRWMETDPNVRAVSGERIEARDAQDGLSTFILREEDGQTRVIHARTAPMSLRNGRAELREKVEEELSRVQRLVRAYAQR